MSAFIKNMKPAFEKVVSPLIDIFHKLNISPNILTLLGIFFISIGSFLLYKQNFFWAGVFILLGNLCDVLDGTLARKYNKSSTFGAFLDSVVDRVSDFLPLIAIAGLFRHNETLFFLSLFAIVFSFLVSYTRARAEGLGIECNIGFFERPERSAILIVSIFLKAVDIAVIIIAVGAAITAIQRIICVYKKTLPEAG
ncbi:MAG: CDP-alcohol phosphatidyltransferase family protein [Aquificae bacterium]|nr:CDP-alcohol phosphatidyltransferase family protein [Aquificota bacterium]